MIEVELPGGTVLEFPDGTSQQDMAKAIQKFDVQSTARERVAKMGPFRKALYGGERSIDESALGLKQLVVGLSDEEKRELAIRREMEDQIPGSSISRIAGDVLQWAVPSKAALNVASRVPALAGTAGRLGVAGATGAAAGALQPVLEGESRGQNAALGAAFGAAGQSVGDVAGRVVSGLVPRNPSTRALPQAVQREMTLGQAADRGTTMGRIAAGAEESAQSIPIVGSVLRRARERGLDSWRQDVLNRAAPPGFQPMTQGTPREQIAAMAREYQNQYTTTLAGEVVRPNPFFERSVLQIVNNPQNGLTREQAQTIGENILRNYQSRFATNPQGGGLQMTGEMAKDFESFLSTQARNQGKAAQTGTNPDAYNLSQLYDQLENAWVQNYYGQISPQARQTLSALDAQYAPFKTVERAVGARGTSDPGMFTPAQLDEAVANRSGRSRFARGEGMLQEQSTQGREIFGSRIPDSGTPERGMWGMALGGGAIVDPVSTATALGTIAATTTGPGKRALMGETAAQQLAQRLRVKNALRDAGLPAGISVADIMQEESERYANAPK